MNLPKAKTKNIVVQKLKDELLVYNLATHQAFTLNETLKTIYSACDGNTSFADLQRSFKFTDDLIHLALSELSANDLLEDYRSDHFAGLSRREAIKRVGLASLVALPVIASIVAPSSAAAAASGSALYRSCEANPAVCPGTDAPYCRNVNYGNGNSGPSQACCKTTFLFALGTGVPGFAGGYASCDDCYNAAAQRCCSGVVTRDSCTNNGGSCSGTCT